ncbi:hypothetical protein CY34DRAFT_78090 [Suillus luteus UH-Slu-Lm8-n1]|uniref:DNA breaking-rejoining enzyme n=1 Tax=Suillus luteus UH-Slu-Lm8-n1 TaxID=930992 RepID=A0A0D0BGW7_9AGAM|nr:hypothetical protein CY34DRAFT_78090 [Suillus luteus UH-Slu-Lm8-n1]
MPLPSPLRPHCLARDRLRLWIPVTTRSAVDGSGARVPVSEDDLDRILLVISHSHAPSTRETYGSGLLAYHVFCDTRNISEDQRCPASPVLLLAFIAACAGVYAGATLENYFYAVRAWHLLHGAPWLPNHAESSLALSGAAKLAPPSSKRPKRAPFTVELISRIRSVLDLSKPLHAAAFACLTTSFFTIARTGEFTVPSLASFRNDPSAHVKVRDIRYDQDRNGFKVVVFGLPRTKMSATGEDVYWAAQSGLVDPHAALQQHLAVNQPPPSAAIFSWRHAGGLRPLTKSAFLGCIQSAGDQLQTGALKGHGIRIGGTLEYLLRGVPFDSVKTMGRWSSNAFVLYLRQHAVVLAPYLQDTPILEPFMRYAIPPPR